MSAVLIVGGGPVGLSLAVRLAQFDVPVTVVEKHADTATFPKGRALSTRTMEIYRSWGLEGELTAAGLPRDQLAFFAGASLADPAATRVVVNPDAHPVPSPAYTLLCSLDHLEPLLRRQASRLSPSTVRFGTSLVDFTPGPDGVTATLRDEATGRTSTHRADYLVAADGARSSVRERSGIGNRGPVGVSSNVNILFNAELAAVVADRRSAVYTITQPGLRGMFMAPRSRSAVCAPTTLTAMPWTSTASRPTAPSWSGPTATSPGG